MKTALIILGSVVGLMAIYLIYRSRLTTAAYVGLNGVTLFPSVPTPTEKYLVTQADACRNKGGAWKRNALGGYSCEMPVR